MAISCRSRSAPLLDAILCVAVVHGCAAPDTPDFEGRDEGVFHPRVRLSYELDRGNAAPAGVGGWTKAAEASFATVQGGFGATTFELSEVAIGLRLTTPLNDRVDLDLPVALGWHSLEIAEPPFRASEEGLGPQLGIGLRVHANERFTLQTRATVLAALPGTTALRGEVGLGVRLHDNLQVLLGYGYWRAERENIDFGPASTDVDVRAEGVLLGLEVQL